MSSTWIKGYIHNLYGYSHVFNNAKYLPELAPGQTAIARSDGSVAGTVAGKMYLFPYGEPPLEIGGGSGPSIVQNVGGGAGVYRDTTSDVINLRSLIGGAGISVATVGDTIQITSAGVGAGYEDISTSDGTYPDPNIGLTDLYANTGGEVQLILGSAAVLGSRKKIILSRQTPGSVVRIIIPEFILGNGILFDTLGMSVSLVYTAGGWGIDNQGGIVY